jgi:type III pantothenate kinase
MPRKSLLEPLLLAIDCSNTGIKFGLYPLAGEHRQVLRARWRISTARERTADEYAALLMTLTSQARLSAEAIEGVIIASVVPQLTPVFAEIARQNLTREAIIVSDQLDLGVRLLVDNPWETGPDRIISTLAAHRLYGGPAIVIQFGTATSFDCVSADGDFLGGAIAPGMGISAEALAHAASRLFQVELTTPPSALGKNTIHAMQSGIVLGHVGLVEGLVTRLRAELPGPEAKVIAHGGLAHVIAKATDVISVVDSNLILSGLRLAYDMVQARSGANHAATHTGY